MSYERINWTTGTKVKEGYTIINGQEYQTVQPEYSGETPVNVENLNHMEDGIVNAEEIDSSQLGTSGYIRLKNGLQIAWVEKNCNFTMASWGQVFYADITDMPNWAQPFTQVYQQYATAGLEQYWFANADGGTTKPGTVRVLRPTGGSYTQWIKVFAIGRWK